MSQRTRVACRSCIDGGTKCEVTSTGRCRRCTNRGLTCFMPPRDAVKIACETCRRRRRKCIPTSGAKCERCTEQNLICIVSPPTQEQQEARRSSGRRHSDWSMTEADSDSEASFDSLFHESQSEPESKSDRPLTRKDGHEPQQTKHVNSTIVTERQKGAATMEKRLAERTSTATFVGAQSGYESGTSDDVPLGKKQRVIPVTPPSRNTSKPTTPQQIQVSPAPLAKMIPTQRDVPKLLIPQSINILPQRQTQVTTTTTATAISDGQPGTLTATSKKSPQYQLENTKLKVHLHGSKGYKPLLLKDCMTPSLFFTKVLEIWSLLDDTVKRLHITFPWLSKEDNGRLMILERQTIKAGLICICDEVETAPCWAEEKGHCSIDVTIFPNSGMMDTFEGPATRDGRSIPNMSVNANRVYWAMRADKQADVGLHVQEIAIMVGMDAVDVVIAGEELLEHCLIITSDESYDVWSLLEV